MERDLGEVKTFANRTSRSRSREDSIGSPTGRPRADATRLDATGPEVGVSICLVFRCSTCSCTVPYPLPRVDFAHYIKTCVKGAHFIDLPFLPSDMLLDLVRDVMYPLVAILGTSLLVYVRYMGWGWSYSRRYPR